MNRTVFTICSANYLATVKVLMDSLHRHEADSRRVLVLVERDWSPERQAALGKLLNCEVLLPEALALPDLQRMAFQYDVTEFNTAVKPFVFQHFFQKGDAAVIYLDPDIKLYQPLADLWQALRQHDAVVTPHIDEPLPDDGLAPSTENMVRCGQYNFGFVGLANQEKPRRFVDWWADRLVDHCIFHPRHFYFVDQFYGAMVSSFIPGTRVWHHQGYNYAYWNAIQRSLERQADDRWTTPDGDLVFFHFSGFVHDDPAALSKHQNRLRADAGSTLETIAIEYGAEISVNRALVQEFTQDYSFGRYLDGTPIDTLERWAYRDLPNTEKALLEDPFDPVTRARLGTYVELDDANGSAAGLLWEVWEGRRRLRQSEQARQQVEETLEHHRQQEQRLAAQVANLEQAYAEVGGLYHEQQRLYDEKQQYVDALHASASYRAGRLVTAPLRWGRSQGIPMLQRGRGLARRFIDHGRSHGWAATLKASARVLGNEGIKGVARRSHTADPAVLQAAPQGGRHPVAALTPHTEPVDVIVCIHNALDDVRNCLDAVLRNTEPPYRLILVDDGSQPETRDFTRQFAQDQGLTLIRNEEAKGYTLAANQGLRASSGAFVVLLNSDTIVTPGWVDRMLRCFRQNPKVGAAGPLSNTASWQSVPRIFDDNGDWSDNALPEGVTVDDMAAQVAALSACHYPRVGFLNGFCYMMRRETLDEIGLFDEETFGRGFGEEDDFSLRARAAGWELAVVDDAYVFHAQSRSYSSERRLKLTKLAGEALSNKHGDPLILAGVHLTQANPVMASMRARMAQCWALRELRTQAMQRYEGRRVAIALESGDIHAANPVFALARSLTQAGIDARLLLLRDDAQAFAALYPQLDVPVQAFDSAEALAQAAQGADARLGRDAVAALPPHYDMRLFTPIQRKQGVHPPVLVVFVDAGDAGPPADQLAALCSQQAAHASVALYHAGPAAALNPAWAAAGLTPTPLTSLSAEAWADALDAGHVLLNLGNGTTAASVSLQAMACGVAIIAPSDTPAATPLVHDESGWLVEAGDTQGYGAALSKLLSDPALRDRLQQAALAAAPAFSPEYAALQALNTLFEEGAQ